MNLSDVDDVLKWENDPKNWEVSENNSSYSRGDIERLVLDLADIEIAKQARFIIEYKGVKVGAVDLINIDSLARTASVGVLVSEDYRRQGIACGALNQLEDESLILGVEMLNCSVHSHNEASLNLFKKLNYSRINESSSNEVNNADYLNVVYFQKCLKKSFSY